MVSGVMGLQIVIQNSDERRVELFRGAYSAWLRLRSFWAEAAEIIPTTENSHQTFLAALRSGDCGSWAHQDPLVSLLLHSDCDGEILPAEAGAMAVRLYEIVPKLSRYPADGHLRSSIQELTRTIADGFDNAHELELTVEFK